MLLLFAASASPPIVTLLPVKIPAVVVAVAPVAPLIIQFLIVLLFDPFDEFGLLIQNTVEVPV